MKKALLLLAFLAVTPSFAAPLPKDGIYLDSSGAPVTEAQIEPPRIRRSPMLPQTEAIHDAMRALPADTATVIELTVTEYGAVSGPVISKSSGSLVLDEYAMNSIHKWRFDPGKRAGKEVAMDVRVPVRFPSLKAARSAQVTAAPMKEPSAAVREAAERNHHPAIPVTCWVNAKGNIEGDPRAENPGGLPAADFKTLASWAERTVKSWTFTPATNPNGQAIPEVITISVPT